MSLIYQALKQNEQQAPAPRSVGAPPPAAPVAIPVSSPSAAGWTRRAMVVALLVCGGVIAGLLLGQRTASAPVPAPAVVAAVSTPVPASSAASPATAALPVPAEPPLPKAAPLEVEVAVAKVPASAAPAPAAEPPVPSQAAPARADVPPTPLPRTEPPLPTVSPRLTMTTALPARPVREAVPEASADATPASRAPAPEAAVTTKPVPATPAATSSVQVSVKAANPSSETPATAHMDVAELFDGLNRALETRDTAAAARHLDAIRTRLPESSLARMRAEGWYAFRTGDLEQSRRVYQRLLDKLPGDENASLALASVERQSQRPDQAREVLSRSLKANPGSSVLRTALDQSPSEAAK